jgi:hypothetical protein
LFRRYDPYNRNIPLLREFPLAVDDPRVEKFKADAENLLENFWDKSHSFETVRYPVSNDTEISPSEWWKNKAGASIIKLFMVWICNLAPSSSGVERLHKVFKSVRTKLRNNLGYERALGLVFLASQHYVNKPAVKLFDWKELQRYRIFRDENVEAVKNQQTPSFEKLTREDNEFLEILKILTRLRRRLTRRLRKKH